MGGFSDLGDVGEEDDEEDEDEDEEEEDDDEEDDCDSSQLSNKSEKNMADFEGELESGCDDELAQLAVAAAATMDSNSLGLHSHLIHHRNPHRSNLNNSSGASSSGNENPSSGRRSSSALNSSGHLESHHFHHSQVTPPALVTCLYSSSSPNSIGRAQSRLSSLHNIGNKCGKSKSASNQDSNVFQVDSICEQGQTLLWDLVQDDKIVIKLYTVKPLYNEIAYNDIFLIPGPNVCKVTIMKYRNLLFSLKISL